MVDGQNAYEGKGFGVHGCNFLIKDAAGQEHLIRGATSIGYVSDTMTFSEKELAFVGITEDNMANLTIQTVKYANYLESGITNEAGMPCEPKEMKIDVVNP